jgi:SAM-dependent methyltransferase
VGLDVEQAEFRDARLVSVYDALCPWSRDDDFFRSVVDETSAARVLDLGCGTGRLALGLTAAGHRVTGVDPARASLDAARAKPGADLVTWVEGTSADLPVAAYDVVLMTSHVAQFLVDDAIWLRTLADIHRALVPGGRLVFDARDPVAREWERWNPDDWRRRVSLPDGSVVLVTNDVTAVEGEAVSFTLTYGFEDGSELTSSATLRFRPEAAVRESLRDSGFAVDEIYGGWQREPVGAGDGELLVIAHTER